MVNSWSISKKLTASDINSGTVTLSAELLNQELFPLWGVARTKRVVHDNLEEMVNVHDYYRHISSYLTMKRDNEGNFTLSGWNTILDRRKFKIDDVIGFRWDKRNARLDFTALVMKMV